MDRDVIAQLMDRWINDPSFRDEVRKDPEGAVRRLGLALSPEDWATLKKMGWDVPDKELRARVSR